MLKRLVKISMKYTLLVIALLLVGPQIDSAPQKVELANYGSLIFAAIAFSTFSALEDQVILRRVLLTFVIFGLWAYAMFETSLMDGANLLYR